MIWANYTWYGCLMSNKKEYMSDRTTLRINGIATLDCRARSIKHREAATAVDSWLALKYTCFRFSITKRCDETLPMTASSLPAEASSSISCIYSFSSLPVSTQCNCLSSTVSPINVSIYFLKPLPVMKNLIWVYIHSYKCNGFLKTPKLGKNLPASEFGN